MGNTTCWLLVVEESGSKPVRLKGACEAQAVSAARRLAASRGARVTVWENGPRGLESMYVAKP